MSIQDVQRYAVIIQGIERIANVIAQYRVVERLYLGKQYEMAPQLEENIKDLYMLVLRFLVKAKKFYVNKSASKEHFHRLNPGHATTISD